MMELCIPWWILYEIILFVLFNITEAGLHWNWQNQHHHHHPQKTRGGCPGGYCKRSWECPADHVAMEPTGPCAYLRGAIWVCCYRKAQPEVVHKPWNAQPSIESSSKYTRGRSNHDRKMHDHHHHNFPENKKKPYDPSWKWTNYNPPHRKKPPQSNWATGTNSGDRESRNHWKGKPGHDHWKDRNMPPRSTRSTKRFKQTSVTKPYVEPTAYKEVTVIPKIEIEPTVGVSIARTVNAVRPNRPRVGRRGTTPMPNINMQNCGLREIESFTYRRTDTGVVEDASVIYPDLKGGGYAIDAIVGGEEVEPFSWPWVAALYRITNSGTRRFLSAGSLINTNFILTAAHVFRPQDLRAPSFAVMLGTHTTNEAVATYNVESVLSHPDYQPRLNYHDIALLKLVRRVIFNDYIMPICLPSPFSRLLRDADLVGKNVTVMGWGDESFGGVSSRVLKLVTFPVISREVCNASYVRVASNRFPRGITEDMLCAGDPKGGKDACQGDSGGPLTVKEGDRYTQVGIVSFGYQCGDKEYPGVYTKVAPYLNWIAQNTIGVNDYDFR